jgi:hypothetical protein
MYIPCRVNAIAYFATMEALSLRDMKPPLVLGPHSPVSATPFARTEAPNSWSHPVPTNWEGRRSSFAEHALTIRVRNIRQGRPKAAVFRITDETTQ